jgi:hypothetical protein
MLGRMLADLCHHANNAFPLREPIEVAMFALRSSGVSRGQAAKAICLSGLRVGDHQMGGAMH